MEHVLLKMAKQLREFDEASLMSLWDKYAAQVSHFEPTKRWEEAVLILAMVQGMRFKNQLFNHFWAEGKTPGREEAPAVAPAPEPMPEPDKARRGKLLAFKPKDEGES